MVAKKEDASTIFITMAVLYKSELHNRIIQLPFFRHPQPYYSRHRLFHFLLLHPCHYLARWVVVAAAVGGGAPGTLPFLYPHNTIKTSIFAQIKTVSHSCTSCRGCWLCNTIMCQVPHNHPRPPNPIQHHPV